MMSDIIDYPDLSEVATPSIEEVGEAVLDNAKPDGDPPEIEEIVEPTKPESNDDLLSLQTLSKTNNTIIKPSIDDNDDEDDDFEDETLAERLLGLTEMFPEFVRDVAWKLSVRSINFAKGFYDFSRATVWILSTSAIILAAPTLIENEKSQLEEMNRQQQRQILLGPSASGGSSLTPSLAPQPIK